jgi:hypothetical protein
MTDALSKEAPVSDGSSIENSCRILKFDERNVLRWLDVPCHGEFGDWIVSEHPAGAFACTHRASGLRAGPVWKILANALGACEAMDREIPKDWLYHHKDDPRAPERRRVVEQIVKPWSDKEPDEEEF